MSRKLRLHHALSLELNPEQLIVEDESYRHQVPRDAETHFKVIAVSTKFEHLRPVARHRLVNTLLAPEFQSGLHALSLHLYTPAEWQTKNATVPNSPPCRNHKHED